MGNKRSGSNFPRSFRERSGERRGSGYNTEGYYQNNRSMENTQFDRREDFPEEEDDTLNTQYDDINTGKYENYNADGYYSSNYGSINELNRGRDYEQNAGYRDSYNRLTTGQWPEIEEAARRRNIDPWEDEKRRRGIHKGKGPRSYQRSDVRLREDINDVLLEDRYVDATDIEVSVENGEVILTGTVENRLAKRRVDDILEQVPGVTP